MASTGQQQIKDFSGHNSGKATAIIDSNSTSLVSMPQTRQLTFAVWIKPNLIPHEFPVLLSKGGNEPGGAYGGYGFLLNADGDNDLVFESGGCEIVTHNANGCWINSHLGEWIHVRSPLMTKRKQQGFTSTDNPRMTNTTPARARTLTLIFQTIFRSAHPIQPATLTGLDLMAVCAT